MSDYEKLEKLISEIDVLIVEHCTVSSPEFAAWENKSLIFLANHFGKESPEYECFDKIRYSPIVMHDRTTHMDFVTECQNGLITARALLEDMLTNMKDTSSDKIITDNKSVFIVHGHDEALKVQAARLLENQGIEAIILNEKGNLGKTIIEKLEHYKNVGAAIILFTPDDKGKAVNERKYKNRARQNVVFEAGYFMGLLGRDKVILLVSDNSIELPSDLNGIVYTDSSWQFKVIQELKDMGFDVDMNKVRI